jgi:mannose-6-phosphate isomerase-like protein (cupin superfamily)
MTAEAPTSMATPRTRIGDLSAEYCHFFEESLFEATERPGFRRRIITGDSLQLWFWRIAGGATGSYLHKHDEHEQLGIVVRGGLDFRIGSPDDERRVVLGPGDLYLAPRSIWHGDSVFLGDDEFGECWILDVFSPPRTDTGPVAGAAVTRLDADDQRGAE